MHCLLQLATMSAWNSCRSSRCVAISDHWFGIQVGSCLLRALSFWWFGCYRQAHSLSYRCRDISAESVDSVVRVKEPHLSWFFAYWTLCMPQCLCHSRASHAQSSGCHIFSSAFLSSFAQRCPWSSQLSAIDALALALSRPIIDHQRSLWSVMHRPCLLAFGSLSFQNWSEFTEAALLLLVPWSWSLYPPVWLRLWLSSLLEAGCFWFDSVHLV